MLLNSYKILLVISLIFIFPFSLFAQPLALKPLEWTVTNTVTANGTPSAVKAAVVGVRHVVTSITACVSISTTVVTNLRVDLKDDTTVVWTGFLNVPTIASPSQCIILPNLNIIGTANKDMTIAFSGALGTTNIGTVTITGYSI